LLLVGGVEPWVEAAGQLATAALRRAHSVVAITPFADAATREHATVLLPCGTFAETSGTYVNLAGDWQGFSGAARPVGEARPAWKILRVLGNVLGLPGFDYESSEAVVAELRGMMPAAGAAVSFTTRHVAGGDITGAVVADFAIYGGDALVRRAPALQATRAVRDAALQPGADAGGRA
jgi:NADH-quinone oxidoreductase subunit G